ncbi:Proline dehydrogenase 1, mitochondrial [Eumeta japonica]|uniref:Proline dehydrogenase 1, mitochondrial n=1 Tax=Eumeta variegata TaxID=151549 RepID=A0A4C1TUL2_EUMVA|nr:Proline dehydrogenase 1, mitochondrial [Eumeta japonica]
MALFRRLASQGPRTARVLSSQPPRDELDLTFNSPKDAFKSKKTSELVRAYMVYQICSINWIVENNDKVGPRRFVGRSIPLSCRVTTPVRGVGISSGPAGHRKSFDAVRDADLSRLHCSRPMNEMIHSDSTYRIETRYCDGNAQVRETSK